jgi:hypothetical protein
MQLGRPVGEVGQWWDDAVDDLHVRSDLDLSCSENCGGTQQRHPCLIRFPTVRAGGPPVLEQLDLEVDQTEVIADLFHPRQAVGGLRGFEIVDGETDTGEAGGGRGPRPRAKIQRTQTTTGNRRCVTGVGPAGGQQLYGHRGSFHLVSGECRQTKGES